MKGKIQQVIDIFTQIIQSNNRDQCAINFCIDLYDTYLRAHQDRDKVWPIQPQSNRVVLMVRSQ